MPTFLTPEQVNELLVELDSPKSKRLPQPIYIGPLTWIDTTLRCASRGCSSPTYVKIEGIPYCGKHALNILNYMVMQCHSDYEDVSFPPQSCTCNAGKHSYMNIHTSDCAIYQELKEKRDKISGDSRSSSDTS